MNRLLSHNLWPTISKLAKNAVKRAAIAYVSSDEYIQFGEGDVLVCDSSPNAIKTGQTSAAVLKRAHDRGASLYRLPGLHAKIVLLNEKALIGSANASESSATNLVEAGLLTDQPTIVLTAQSFVNQLRSQAEELNENKLQKLLEIKVTKRMPTAGTAKAGVKVKPKENRTWIIGTAELLKEFPEEQEVVDEVIEGLSDKLSNPRSSVNHIRWSGNSRFREVCEEDDWLIQMWRPKGRKNPSWIYEPMPVVERVETDGVTYFLYEEFPKSDLRTKTWSNFKKLATRAGITRHIKPGSQFEITEIQADILASLWKEA